MIKIILPEPPSLIHASRSDQAVLVEWDAVGDESIKSYIVYRNEQGKTPGKTATVKPEDCTYKDSKVRKGAVYYYSVSSVDDKGREGRRSEAAYVVP
jgi:fibronectin type 3 domain-containing protein